METLALGSIKFYDDEKKVLFPKDYKEFNLKLGQMLGLTGDFLKCVKMSYLDEEKDNVEIKNESDYQQFFESAKKQEGKAQINIQIAEESNIDIKKCSDSMIAFVENANIVEQEKNSTLSKEVNKGESNNEPKNEKSKEKLENGNINNGNKKENVSNQINQNNNNNINQNNTNQINNNNQNNIVPPHQNRQNNQPQVFNIGCHFCKRFPLNQVVYFCKDCNCVFCSLCEQQIGIVHEHPIYKIQNQNQFNYFHFSQNARMEKIMNDIGKKAEDVYNSVYNSVAGFFGIKNDNNNNNNPNNINNANNINNDNNQIHQAQRQFSLIEQARSRYDLSKVSDKEIEEALKKTNNNIDDAVILLFPQ